MAYYGEAHEVDRFFRGRRSHDPAGYYGHSSPYGHPHEQTRYDLRPEQYHGAENQTYIGQPEAHGGNDSQTRRRIAMACSRCRRRKIKCSGDPGDNSGCVACKSSGADINKDCMFNRVNSETCTWRSFPDQDTMGVNVMPLQSASYSSLISANSRHGSHNLHRPSLPALQIRSTYPPELGSDYNPSPVDYTYASSGYPRHDSFSNTYALENYRSWSTTAPMTAPITTSTYDPQSGFIFGSVSGSSMPYSQAESLSALNMGHLNASLPGSMVHDRRLPIPYIQQEPSPMPFSTGELPELRPLDRYPGPRSHFNAFQGRQNLPWVDTTYTTSSGLPTTTHAPINGLPTQTTDTQSDPAFSYQFGMMPPMTTNSSPEVSPTTGPNSSGSFQSTSSSSTNPMLPRAQVRYSSASIHGLPSITTDIRPSSSRGPSSALYDYNSERTDVEANNTNDRTNTNSNTAWPSRSSAPSYSSTTYPSLVRAVDCESSYSRDNSYSYHSLRQPQPQNPAGVMSFCRQPSYGQLPSEPQPQSQQQDQQQQPSSRQDRRERRQGEERRRRESGTARGRMSIENINAPY